MTTVVAQRITSPLVKSLEDTWAVIRRHHPELPTVAFTLGSGTETTSSHRRGHFPTCQAEVRRPGAPGDDRGA